MEDNQHECQGCAEYQELSRRGFLGVSKLAAAAALTAPAWLPRVVLARDYASTDALVVVFLRGAIDGLSAIVPYGDVNYYSSTLRPGLAVPPPGDTGGATDLDGFFGLSPAMAALLPAYQSGQLAIVHATGSPDPSRSHFDAFKIMEYGTPLQPLTLTTGWLGRHLVSVPPLGSGLLRAVAVSNLVPKSLAGAPATVPAPDPGNYSFPDHSSDVPEQLHTAEERRDVLQFAYESVEEEPLTSSAMSTLDTIDLLASVEIGSYVPSGGALYPESAFGNALKSTAALLKADIGVEAITIDKGGWDTHNAQGNLSGPMFNLMDDLSSGLAAFHLDIQSNPGEMTLVLMSEFGRRADQNGSLGTDHGHGSIMMAMGRNIAGGQVLAADWTPENPLLHPDLLHQGDSLSVTIDYRDVISEVLARRIGNTDLATVFPNYKPTFPGITVS